MVRSKDSKILILTSVYTMGYGVSLVIEKQYNLLCEFGFSNVSIATIRTDHSTSALSHVHTLSGVHSEFENFINETKPEIIICHTPPFFHYVSELQCEVIKIAYDHGEPSPFLFPTDMIEREVVDEEKYRAISGFNLHISISEFIKRESGISNSQVLYNGVDHMDYFELEKESKALFAGRFVIGTLTRIGGGEASYKGYSQFLQLKRYVERTFGLEKELCFFVNMPEKDISNNLQIHFLI